MKIKNKGLGKGLDALIKPDFYEETSRETAITNISINRIEPNDNQPRSSFDDQKIQELSASIKKQGVLQPILLRKTDHGQYQIIAGERRWRASIDAGLNTIPAIVRDYDDAEALAVALIENLQREDLNVMEQAAALDRLKNELKINQEELADSIGKSRSHLANILRLLNLPETVQDNIRNNHISAGHARALLSLKDQESIIRACDQIIEKGLSVREAEKLTRSMSSSGKSAKKVLKTSPEMEKEMQDIVCKRVNKDLKVKFSGNNEKGRLTISYSNNRQLQDLIGILKQNQEAENG